MEFSSNSEEHKEQKQELVGYLCDKYCVSSERILFCFFLFFQGLFKTIFVYFYF